MDYVHFNPIKPGVAEPPAAWPYSSFLNGVAQGLYPEGWALAEVSLPEAGERAPPAKVG